MVECNQTVTIKHTYIMYKPIFLKMCMRTLNILFTVRGKWSVVLVICKLTTVYACHNIDTGRGAN